MGLIGKGHGHTLAKQEKFSSGGFGSVATSPLFAACSSCSSSNQPSLELAATGPSAFPPPLFGPAASSNINNPGSFELAVTGPSAYRPPLFGAASSSNISNPGSFGFAATGASASPPPLFGVASSSNISNPGNFGFAASGASASPQPLFGVASSSNISNPVNFGFAPTGPSVFRPPFFCASSSNTTSPANFALAGTGPSISAPPLFDSASSSSKSSPATFGFSASPPPLHPSLFAASSSGNSSTQALSWPAVLPPRTSSFNVFPSLFALENPIATSTSPVFCSSSSNMTSLPKQSPFAPSSTDNAITVASPPVFGCGFIVNSSSGSSGVAFSSTPSHCFLNIPRSQTDSFPAPSAPSSIFTTSATATVLPPKDSSNKQESPYGSFGSLAGPSTFCASSSSISSTQAMSSGFLPFTNSVNAFSSLSSQINPSAVGFSSSKIGSSPTKVLFATTNASTTAGPPVSKFEFWPPINSSNAPPSFDFSGTPLHCFAKIPSLSQKDSQPARPLSSIFPTATTTTILPARGEEVRKPTPHLCPSCGQTLLTGTVYSPTPDRYQPGWLQSISAMPENEAKSLEELRWANHLLQGVTAMPQNQAISNEELGWGDHLQGKAKDAAAPVAHQSTISSQPQWTLPVMVLPVMPMPMPMPLPTWNTLPYTPALASASTLPAFPANGAAFGYAYSPSLSGTPMMPAGFNLCDMFRRL